MSNDKLQHILKESGFVMPAFHTYGGKEGYNDIGPLGTTVKNKLLKLWRDEFLQKEDIDEIECPTIMPEQLLKYSGHVDKFTDYVVYDKYNNEFRADHLVNDFYAQKYPDKVHLVDSMKRDELEMIITKDKLIELDEGSSVKVMDKNLMFKLEDEYLRPELAQGIFVNAQRYSQQMRKELPFGLAQIGKSYRKEISPKPFLRMREFFQAEIEFFYDPTKPIREQKIDEHLDTLLPVYTRAQQELDSYKYSPKSVKFLLENSIIQNEYLLHYLIKTNKFAKVIGIKRGEFRFRQHQQNEMAHYAKDCWDLECKIGESWIECAGFADRECFDLKSHQIQFARRLDEPKIEKVLQILPNKKLIGKTFMRNSSLVLEYIQSLSHDDIISIEDDFKYGIVHLIEDVGELTKEMVMIEEKDIKVNVEYFYPNVIEPSFGIDRLLYAVYFNSFWERDSDENRTVLSFKQKLVPYDIAVLQLSNNEEIMNKVNILSNEIRQLGYKVYNDQSSGSIGRRYSRLDKIGIKYTITVDFDSLKDNTVTIRERDLMGQERKMLLNPDFDYNYDCLKCEMEEINNAYGYEDIDEWCYECKQHFDGYGCTENECNRYKWGDKYEDKSKN